MKPKVFLTQRLTDAVMERLAATTDLTFNSDPRPVPPEDLAAAIRGCDGVIPTVTERMDAALFDACPNLRVVANFGVGVNHIDTGAATDRGIVVTNTPGVLTAATADLTLGLIIATARRFGEGERLVREGRWKGCEPLQLLGGEASGATLGIIGFGRIGQAVAHRARAFEMRVLYWNRTRLKPGIELEQGIDYRERDDLLAEADIVTIHTAYTPETHHLIDATALERMKPTAILVNAARGPIVDEKALVAALERKTIAAAGIDVFEREPHIEAGFYKLENCVLLPHLGSATLGTRTRMGMLAADNLLAVFAGTEPPNCVNPQVLVDGLAPARR